MDMAWVSACDPSDHLQESLGPPGPKSQKKSQKESSQKSLKKSLRKKVSKRVFLAVYKNFLENTRKSKKYPKLDSLGNF